jgi:ABC-type nitrate/sulfonate/bicarbonate transport system permease component
MSTTSASVQAGTIAADAPMRRRRLRSGPTRQAISAGVLLLLWQGVSTWVTTPETLPSPVAVLSRAAELTQDGALMRHVGATLARVVIGYVVGAVLGTAFGLFLGHFSWIERLLGPSFGFVRSIPPIAWVPFSIIVFGIGEASKYAIIVYLVFIVLAMSAAAGVRETPRIRVRAAQALGASPRTVLLKVVLPSAFPFILTGLGVALNLAFMAVVSAELIGARSGLGSLITHAQTMFESDTMLVGILSLGVIGGLLSHGADWMIRRGLGRFSNRVA